MKPGSWLGALLAITTLLVTSLGVPLVAQERGVVQHVLVRSAGHGLEVEIQTSGTAAPQSQMIANPDRIIVDFPGALPAASLRNLSVNQGPLKAIRSGLFSANPPVTRVVLDLLAPQPYQIFSVRTAVMLKLGTVSSDQSKVSDAQIVSSLNQASSEPLTPAQPSPAPASPPPPTPRPPMEVTFENGLLQIHAEKATLAQVLYEVQRQTGAEIAIPAGAESEEIFAELGPAPPRDVLASLLNGSRYNFIFVGNDHGHSLQKAILTIRDGGTF